MDRTDQESLLTAAKIFSTMELMGTLKLLLYLMGPSFNFYFDIKIILDRFCSIFNIRDVRMIRIDASTKKPIVNYEDNQ